MNGVFYMTSYKKSKLRPFSIIAIFFIFASFLLSVYLFRNPKSILKSEAAGVTFSVGSAGGLTFYRTNFATEAQPVRCWAKAAPQGFYDSATNKTFVVYGAGIDGASNVSGINYSEVNPYVIAYNHGTKAWVGPVLVSNVSKPNKDCHYYSQIIKDKNGYLHVFYSFHSSGNIKHFVSRNPGDITSWNTLSDIPNTSLSAYANALVDNQGEIYVFYRSTEWDGKIRDSNPNTNNYYELEMYVKSTDAGKSWTNPRVFIDPGEPIQEYNSPLTTVANTTGWNTIYTGDYYQDFSNNQVYITFTPGYVHSVKFDSLYIFKFSLTTDKAYSMKGTDLGSTVDFNEYSSAKCCTLTSPSGVVTTEFADKYAVGSSSTFLIENGFPVVYFSAFKSYNGGSPDSENYYKSGENRLKKALWGGNEFNPYWVITYVGETDNVNSDPFANVNAVIGADYKSGEGTTLYVKSKQGGNIAYLPPDACVDSNNDGKVTWPVDECYQYPAKAYVNNKPGSGGQWQNTYLFGDHRDWEVRGVSNFGLIRNAHPAIRGWLVVPKYTTNADSTGPDFSKQYAIGAHYVLGSQPF